MKKKMLQKFKKKIYIFCVKFLMITSNATLISEEKLKKTNTQNLRNHKEI